MKDFVKLTKETWQFYLTALCVILLPVVSNNMYVLRELKLQKENTVHLYKLSEEFLEKTNGGDLLSFWVVIAGIVILLFIRHFLFMDRRTMEFQFSLPVKKRMMVLHDYLCIGGGIIISWLVTMCMYAVTQGTHNKVAVSMNRNLSMEAAKAASELWKIGFNYVLYLLCAYSLLYLVMIICKKKMAGIAVLFFVWLTCVFCEDIFSESYTYLDIMPEYFFQNIMNESAFRTVWLLAGILFLLISMIVLAAEKRELSSGRWFYFRWLEWVPIIICCTNGLVFYYNEWGCRNKGIFLIGMVIVLAAGFALGWFCKQSEKKSRNKWEVK